MPRGVPNSPESEDAMRGIILEAAAECFAQLGMEKTSLTDVARVAEISRGTVYRYFNDRQTLIDEVVEAGARDYFSDAAAAMETKGTLAKQMGAFAAVAAQTAVSHRSATRLLSGGDVGLMRVIIEDSEETLRRTIDFLIPYIEQSKKRGEIAKATRTTEAAEWLGRIIMSITSAPTSPHFDITHSETVARFVERFAVKGLAT